MLDNIETIQANVISAASGPCKHEDEKLTDFATVVELFDLNGNRYQALKCLEHGIIYGNQIGFGPWGTEENQ